MSSSLPVQPEKWRGVVLANDEKLVREYHASHYVLSGFRAWAMSFFGDTTNQGGDQYLGVTTDRLLLVGDAQVQGGTGRVVGEVQIGQVSGLSCSIARNWMAGWALLRLVALAAAGLAGVVVLGILSPVFWLLLLVWAWWVIRELASQGERISLTVHATNAQTTPVGIKNEVRAGRFNGHFDVFDLRAGPGPDAEAMTVELGAVVDDIQTDATSALERWPRIPKCSSAAARQTTLTTPDVGPAPEPAA